MFCSKIKIIRSICTNFSRAMAPAVGPTAGHSVDVPDHNETESGSHRLPDALHRVTEAAPVVGNVKLYLIFIYYVLLWTCL